MIVSAPPRGIWSAVVTPVDPTYEPDAARAAEYYLELLATGCDGLNVLGTTGEAMSFSVEQRVRFMRALIERGIPADRMMCGTGASALADARVLLRTASELGLRAALVMPPFFYRDATDDGVVRFFDALLHETGNAPIVLYHFPRMSGIAYAPHLVKRLIAAHPGRIVGMKESMNDAAFQQSIIAAFPGLALLPGSEEFLGSAREYGVAGCISGSVALWPQLARRVLETGDTQLAHELAERRRSLAGGSLIENVRARIAHARGDDAWLRSVPPLR